MRKHANLLLYSGIIIFVIFYCWMLVSEKRDRDASLSSNTQVNADQYRNTGASGSEQTQNSLREAKIKQLFERFKSPFIGKERDFLALADEFSLDWRLLPTISCIESGCGKHYTFNAFGWGSDTIECGSDMEDAKCVAKGIAKGRSYERFRDTGSLYNFARAYNPKNWENYLNKLNYYYDLLAL